MQIKRAILKNICQHEYLDVSFKPGVTGIFGPSAAGKSNLVNMIQASWTNDFSINPGTKNENIRRDIPTGEESWIKTFWEHDGCAIKITRSLLPQAHELIYHDQKFTKAAEISELLESIVGVSRRVVDEYVFVSQWNVFEFLTADVSDRRKSFMRLCGLESMFDYWKVLGDQHKADQQLIQFSVEDLDDVAARVATRTAEIEAKTAELSDVSTSILSPADEERLREKLSDIKNFAQCAVEIDNADKSIERQTLRLNDILADIKDVDSKLQLVLQEIDNLSTRLAALDTLKKSSREYDSYRALVDDVAKLKDSAPLQPTVVDDKQERQRVAQELFRVENDLQSLKAKLKKFSSGEEVNCDGCDRPLSKTSNIFKNWEVRAQELATDKATLESQQSQLKAIQLEWDAYQKAKANNDTLLNAAQFRLSKATEVAKPAEKYDQSLVDTLNKTLREIEKQRLTFLSQLRPLNQTATELRQAIAVAEGLKETYTKKQAATKAAWEEAINGNLSEAKIKARLDASTNCALEAKGLQATINELKRVNVTDNQYLDKLKRAKEKTSAARKWLSMLDSWRGVLHPSNLPESILRTLMVSTLEKVNDVLAQLSCDFRVSTTDGLNFVIKKPLGYEEPAIRLSGGEKVALGVAFRLAVVGHVGLMVLDEPTAGLDSDRFDSFVTLLSGLSEVTKNGEQQIIIITHDDRLTRALDHKIVIDRVV